MPTLQGFGGRFLGGEACAEHVLRLHPPKLRERHVNGATNSAEV